MSKQLSFTRNPLSFTHGDPLLALIRGRFHISPWVGTLVGGLLINLPIILLATINNFWIDRDGLVGLVNDLGWWALQLTLMPATLFYYFWGPDLITNVLQGLVKNRAIIIPPPDEHGINLFDKFIERFDKSFSNRLWIFISFAIALAFVWMIIPIHRTFKSWMLLDEIAFWYNEFFWFLMLWLVTLLIFRAAMLALWFNRLFQEFRIDVKPLHRDGAGGLAPLGNLSVRLGYGITIYGIALAATILTQSYLITQQFGVLVLTTPIIILIVIYLILAPLAFFSPIVTAHLAMDRARHEILGRIAEQLEFDLAIIQNSLTQSADELKATLDKIDQLHRAYALVSRFPVWPLNTANLVRFVSSILSPIVIALAPTVGSLLLRLVR